MGSKKTARKPVWAPWYGEWNIGWFPEHRMIPQYWGWIGIPDVGMEGCGVWLWGETVLGTALSARPAFCRTWSRGIWSKCITAEFVLPACFFLLQSQVLWILKNWPRTPFSLGAGVVFWQRCSLSHYQRLFLYYSNFLFDFETVGQKFYRVKLID